MKKIKHVYVSNKITQGYQNIKKSQPSSKRRFSKLFINIYTEEKLWQ